jgi:predicted O-methyltransferase YrrM
MDIRWHISKFFVKTAVKLLNWSGWYKGYWNYWRGEIFDYCQAQGLHILPVHFYTPIPDTSRLPESLWSQESELISIELNIDSAIDFLAKLSEYYQSEYAQFSFDSTFDKQQFYLNNSAYGCGDAEILYSMIRHFKPRRVIEIGSGMTTLIISQALRQNFCENPEKACNFLAIEPYPPDYLKPLPNEVSRMLSTKLQEAPLEEFTALESNDLLFIDSTHVVNIGSDVVYEYLEILPRLAPGVIVHIHDIFFPMNYPRDWIHESRFFWNEQYLLQAFLTFNQKFKVLMPTYALSQKFPEVIEAHIQSCAKYKYRPSSFWLKSDG